MLVKSHCHTDARSCFFSLRYQPLEQFFSRNSRCTVSKCFQETLGISATEEDGLLHGLLVLTTLLAAVYARYDASASEVTTLWRYTNLLIIIIIIIIICLCYMMIAFGAATPGEMLNVCL